MILLTSIAGRWAGVEGGLISDHPWSSLPSEKLKSSSTAMAWDNVPLWGWGRVRCGPQAEGWHLKASLWHSVCCQVQVDQRSVLTRSIGWAVQGWALTLHGQDAAVQAQHAGFALCSWAFQVFLFLNEAVSFPSACTCTSAGVSFSVCAGWQGRAWCCLRHSHGPTHMSLWASHHLPFQRIILNRQVGKRATRITQRQEMTLSISKIK